MSFGVTPSGFIIKRLNDIVSDIGSRLKGSLGAGINLDGDSIIGETVGAISERIAELWEVALSVYGANYPDSASDVSLDGSTSNTGVSRQAATFSTVPALLTGTDGSTVPSGNRSAVVGRPDSIFATQSAVSLTRLACAAALIQVSTITPGYAYTITVNGTPYSYVSTSTAYTITVADDVNDKFTFAGNVAARFYAGRTFTVTGSAGNDGNYTVLSAVNSGGNTIVTVTQDITSAVAGGSINLADDAGDIAAGLVAALVAQATTTPSASGADSVYILADDLTIPFSVVAGTNLTLTTVSAYHVMEATVTGDIDAPVNSLTVIVTPATGWLSVNNPTQATVGRNEETDTELRARRLISLKIIGAGTVDAIRARVLEVTGVTACSVNENTTDVVQTEAFAIIAADTGADTFTLAGDVRQVFAAPFGPNATFVVSGSTGNNGTYTTISVALVGGNTVVSVAVVPSSAGVLGQMTLDTLPGKSFEVVADGGVNQTIADTIWANKPAGIQTFGVSETEVADDTEGNPHTLYFSRPSQVTVYCDIQYTALAADEGEQPPVEADMATAVEAYFDNLVIGGNVIPARIEAEVTVSTTGLDTVVARIGFSAAPTGTATLAISKRQRAVLSTPVTFS